MTVSRRATRGRSRTPVSVVAGPAPRPGWTVAWPCRGAPDVRSVSAGRAPPTVDRGRSVNGRPSIDRVRWFRGPGRLGLDRRCLGVAGPFGVERLEDPSPEALLELEQDADAGEVDAALAGQVADPEDPPDVVLAVQADVGRRPRRAEEPLVLVDPQRARMRADDARRHADDVDGPLGRVGRGVHVQASAREMHMTGY